MTEKIITEREIELEAQKILAGARVETQEERNCYENAKPLFYEGLSRACQEFQRKYGIPKSVFYPCCGMDTTPVKAFPNSEVILLERDRDVTEALKRNGIEAICSDIRDYTPREKHDLLIMLNPQISAELATPYLINEGHIICNNYHSTAKELFENPQRYSLNGHFNYDSGALECSKELNANADRLYLFSKKCRRK